MFPDVFSSKISTDKFHHNFELVEFAALVDHVSKDID
jgi:hypothetical protein